MRPACGPARVVETSKSYEPAEQTVGTLTNVLVGAALAAFLLSVGGAYLLAGAALRPVEAVTRAARGISEEATSAGASPWPARAMRSVASRRP